jgi:drug/metabolite transporter (DMT)-like permease
MAIFATSIYSLSNKVAVSYLPGFGAQLGFISIGYLASFIGLTIFQYRATGSFIPACRPKPQYILTGGLFIGTAYALVVRAMLELPAAYVVAYTNAGIVLATGLSICLFKEREKWASRIIAV